MEGVALINVQLDMLAENDKDLKNFYCGAVACDKLPNNPHTNSPRAYIVNTDPYGKPGQHWIALWTKGNKCEVMDSYGVPLDVYGTTEPLQSWLHKKWKYVIYNGQTLQALNSQSCGHYVLMYLVAKSRGYNLQDFIKLFSKTDFVKNDYVVGQWLKAKVECMTNWNEVCKRKYEQCCQ